MLVFCSSSSVSLALSPFVDVIIYEATTAPKAPVTDPIAAALASSPCYNMPSLVY